MDGVRGDDPISILGLHPLQGDGGVVGGVDAGSWLANRLCTNVSETYSVYTCTCIIICMHK